jgi:1,4-alpha-glucan branching enzyme
MEFVLALHTHLPYVLNHGRWPHGSDWLTEATLDTYLPMLEALLALEAEGTPTPATIGITPVLANQLASPDLVKELETFFEQRLAASREAPAQLEAEGSGYLIPVAKFWEDRILRLRRFYESLDGDMTGAFRGLAERGRIELISSAATHGFLPMLGAEQSIRLQLDCGRQEHRRIFGGDPNGIWLPECAYRPRGPWRPFDHSAWDGPVRPGIEEHLADFGYGFFFTDAHMVRAGAPLGLYGISGDHGWPQHVANASIEGNPENTPYRAYRANRVGDGPSVAAFARDPRSSAQVWSRHGGYPGAAQYLEFHKTRWPGGLKFWRVSEAGADLGQKGPYDPRAAYSTAVEHGRHFAELVRSVAIREQWRTGGDTMVCAPFDTELFGHWWFEGPEFLSSMWRAFKHGGPVRPVTASAHLAQHPLREGLALAPGSWGKDGDWSMWNGRAVEWTWEPIWKLEGAFWDIAPAALQNEQARPVLAQLARTMLLTQSSDWQFIISTGEADDYAIKRLTGHLHDADGLLGGLRNGLETGEWDGVRRFADECDVKNALFPNVLDSVAAAARLI